MKNVSVITNYNIADKAKTADAVAARFARAGAAVSVPAFARGRIGANVKYATMRQLYDEADMIAVIGGDGSVLEAARRAAERGTPLLGINKGRLGYMTELEVNELDLIDDIVRGNYKTERRSMVRVEVLNRKRELVYDGKALNDAVVSKGSVARLVDFELKENGVSVGEFRADGIIIATPTGSTAYSLSAGGPIVSPQLRGICVTPICAHSLRARSMIFPDSDVIEIKNTCVREPHLFLTVDGKGGVRLEREETVRISHSEKFTALVRVKENNFYTDLLNKL